MVFRVRELLIRQRTQAINALRGHLAEFGQIVPQGVANASRLIAIFEDPDCGLPADAIPTLKVLIAALAHLEAEIGKLDAQIARRAKESDVARRLMTVPPFGHARMPCRATGHWSADRHCHRGAGPAAGDLPQGARLRGLARLGAAAAFYRGQTTPRGHDEDGRTIPEAVAHHRGQQRHHQAACPCRCPTGHMAGRDADAQAADAGAGGAGEQDGADRLGLDGSGRRLPVSGRGGISPPSVARGSERKRGKEQFGAIVVRRNRENQCATECLRARGFDLDPTFEHHTGPRHLSGRIRGRTHVSTR